MKVLSKKFRVGGNINGSVINAASAPAEQPADDDDDDDDARQGGIESTRDSLQLMGHPDFQPADAGRGVVAIEVVQQSEESREDGWGGCDHDEKQGGSSKKTRTKSKSKSKSRRDSLQVLRGPATILRGHAHKQRIEKVKKKEGYTRPRPEPMDASRTSTSTCSTANTDASYYNLAMEEEMVSLDAPCDEDQVQDDDDVEGEVACHPEGELPRPVLSSTERASPRQLNVDWGGTEKNSPKKSCLTVKSMQESLQSCRSGDETVNECEADAATETPPPRRNDSSTVVGFLTVEFREYPPELGDNPACQGGPPLTLGWDHDRRTVEILPLEEYERIRPARRKAADLHLPNHVRVQSLKRAGFTKGEIAACVRRTNRDRDRRYWTTSHLKFSRVHETGESAGRKLQRLVLMRHKDEDVVENLWRARSSLSSSSSCEELGSVADDQVSVASEEQ